MNNPLTNVHNPLAHLDIDTKQLEKQFESAVGGALEIVTDRFGEVADVVGDRFGDVADVVGDRLADDVIPAARRGARRTQTFVRTRTRVSVATVAGVVFVIGLVMYLKRRRRDDAATDTTDVENRRGPRSVA